MDTQTTEASEQLTNPSAVTDDVEPLTVTATPADHVEQSIDSAALTDQTDQSTVSVGPVDHVEQSTVSVGLVDHVEQSTVSVGLVDHVEQSTVSVGLVDHVEQSTVSVGLVDHLEQPTISADLVDHSNNAELPNHGALENQHEFAEVDVRTVLEGIASTGKYRDGWEKLKNMLSFYLKQVLSKYPEATLSNDQQISTLGESYTELVKRLDDALGSFVEGPPFTIQRLCEILLGAENIYPKLSKLSLALEKNLLVTSTLSISSDPHQPVISISSDPHQPVMVETVIEADKATIEEPQLQSVPVENGVEPMVAADKDEIMTEVEEEADVDEMTIDMAFEDIVRSSSESSAAMSTDHP